ncbi:hypothetical protein [Phyllobacterium leguminum]|uniref:hypothetical protein n=1 Tax=Phyllobacterium leguminum TaxID=314237 RepID=UPI000DA15C94|nr:hypothetical protein [Phyllobacterium leguminum]
MKILKNVASLMWLALAFAVNASSSLLFILFIGYVSTPYIKEIIVDSLYRKFTNDMYVIAVYVMIIFIAVIHFPSGLFGRFQLYVLLLRSISCVLALMGLATLFYDERNIVLEILIVLFVSPIPIMTMVLSIRSMASMIHNNRDGKSGIW